MINGFASILLVGRNLQSSPELRDWLDKRKVACERVELYRDAYHCISRGPYELVVSEYQLPDRTALSLTDALAGSPATLFFCRAVTDHFLWLIMLEQGRRCVGYPVVRSHNLHGVLDRVLPAMPRARQLDAPTAELSSTSFAELVSSSGR
jgi:hypothetical protein